MKIVADANIPFVAECFSSVGEVEVVAGRQMSAEVAADADVLLVRSVTKVDEDLLKGSRVRFVGTATIGFEHVDTEYLEAKGIGFASAPGSNANSVAEYVVAGLLWAANTYEIRLAGKSIGIVGVGNVGGKVEEKAKALGMNVMLNDPPLRRQTGDEKYLPLDALFGCSFVTLHTPLTFEGVDKTFHLANEGFFKSLKQGCGFLNTARGGVVDSAALKGAISSGRLKSAVLDVWENEPNIDIELLRKVDLGTPHIAGYSFDGKVAGMTMIYEAVCEYFGLEANNRMNDFLPEPEVGKIEISDEECDADEQDVLRKVVEQVYAINRDDSRMREIAFLPAGEAGRLFDELRKNYPVRREFGNTTVVLPRGQAGLLEKLRGIGFQVEHGK